MAKQLPAISDQWRAFLEQHLFFVDTAAPDGRVNVSPKEMNRLRVLGPNRAAWLNATGSGNETAAHLLQLPRMTLMFCAFQGAPLILRLYGQARMIQPPEDDWAEFCALFPALPGVRQVCVLEVDLVQTSCVMAVPLMDFQQDRDDLNAWAERQTPEDLDACRQHMNVHSLNGFSTGLPATVDT